MSLPDLMSKIINFGGTGIHLFILMSGYGLYFSYLRKPLSYTQFMKRRFIRLYIPYIFVVLISAFLAIFIPIYKNSLYALGGHIFMYKMFDESIMGSYGYPLWFISMIFQFYFIFHILVWIKNRINDNLFLIGSVIISLSWSLVVILLNKETMRIWNSFFLQYIWEFALGIVIASWVYHKKKKVSFFERKLVLFTFGIINCMIYALMAIKGGEAGKMLNDIFALFGYTSLAIWLYLLRVKLVNVFFVFIGSISLSVYLLHILVLLLLIELNTGMPIEVTALVAMVAVIFVSIFYQRIIAKILNLQKI